MAQELVPVVKTIVGDREQVANALRTTHAAGRLLTDPLNIRPVTVRGNRYAVKVRVLEPRPEPTRRERLAAFDRRHPVMGPVLKALTFSLSVLVVVAAALFAVGALIVHTIGLRTIGTGAGAVLVLVAIFLLARGGGSGHGDHKGMGWHYTKCK